MQKNGKVILFSEAYKVLHGDDLLMREYLGGKGAGLAQMTNAGINVPPGLTINTKACVDFMNSENHLPERLMEEVFEKLRLHYCY